MEEIYIGKLEEECGIFGVYTPERAGVVEGTSHTNPAHNSSTPERNATTAQGETEVAPLLYLGLLALQHRGQESAGASTQGPPGTIATHRGMGLVSGAFTDKDVENLKGNIGIGHVRYSTAGASSLVNAQPLQGHCKLGDLAIAHNGTLVNGESIRRLLEDGGAIFRTSSDSEVLLHMIARRAEMGVEEAVIDTMSAIKGSYALTILVQGKLIGARDPYGIRPLCIGQREDTLFLSSESCALDAVGATFLRDVKPGEIVMLDERGITSLELDQGTQLATCIFEYIYFARPDSIIDRISVHISRERMGEALFAQCGIIPDIVVGVPDSGVPGAMGYAAAAEVPYKMGFIKNRYVGRTFINPSQEMRERAIDAKLSALRHEVEGKSVMLIDDSIVRGNTSKKLIDKMRLAGAREIHFGVVSPPISNPCYFGIDTPQADGLIANQKSIEEIRKLIGCDTLTYLSLEGLLRAMGDSSKFCLGCLTGTYPVSPHKIKQRHMEA